MGEKLKQPDKPAVSTGFSFLFTGHFFSGRMLFLGLAGAQVIATIHIYLSNTELFRSLENLNNVGYLIIPNHNIMNSLQEFSPAFFGGLFFSLSAGALLSLLGLASAFTWDRLFKREIKLLIPFLILWTGLMVLTNKNGFSPLITAYFLFIPSIVFIAASRYMPPAQYKNTGYLPRILFIFPILLIVTLSALRIDSGIFTDVRDYLLLTNNPGKKVNDFYYQYTLYPAEAIKSLDQKILKTYRFDNVRDKNLTDQIKKRLINFDFIEINNEAAKVDLAIDEQDNSLIFSSKGSIILTTSTMDFLKNTQKTLSEISMKTDRLSFFRYFIFLSLLTGLPLTLFIFFYSILGFFLNLFLSYRHASSLSLYACLTIAVLFSVFLYNISGKRIDELNLPEALDSARWYDRVMALRTIDENEMDISRFEDYQEMLSSPYIPVRYWLAKALGRSRDPEGYKTLLKLMNDQCPNVVCMAFYSLGQRGAKSSVSMILERIQLSDHWYEQWYAYKALRALGWKQTISK